MGEFNGGFALLVVLFILLIIIGASYNDNGYGGGYY
ncbi:YjcZ family sporulation protein [Lentibacillus sediminis]|nr:YjcZ family sporulation protein [Lentibacillus sediminis]